MPETIPITLRIAKDDFFVNFLHPLREQKELSKFILNALRGYYYDADVKDALDAYIANIDPMATVYSYINSIQSRISSDIAMTEAFSDDIQTEGTTPDVDAFSERLQKIESQLQAFGDAQALVNEMREMLTKMKGGSQPTIQAVIPIASNVLPDNYEISLEDGLTLPDDEDDENGVAIEDLVDNSIHIEPKVEEPVEQQEEKKVEKPATFNKMLASMKKKGE